MATFSRRVCDRCHAAPAVRYFPVLPGDLAFCPHDAGAIEQAVADYAQRRLDGWMADLDDQVRRLPETLPVAHLAAVRSAA